MQWTPEPNADSASQAMAARAPELQDAQRRKRAPGSQLKNLEFLSETARASPREPALLDGDYVPLNENDSSVISYLRRTNNQVILVVLNMCATKRQVPL